MPFLQDILQRVRSTYEDERRRQAEEDEKRRQALVALLEKVRPAVGGAARAGLFGPLPPLAAKVTEKLPKTTLPISHFMAGVSPLPVEQIALGEKLPEREKYTPYRAAGGAVGALASGAPVKTLPMTAGIGGVLGGGMTAVANLLGKRKATEDILGGIKRGALTGLETAPTQRATITAVGSLAKGIPALKPLTEAGIKAAQPTATQTLPQALKSIGQAGLRRMARAAILETPVEGLTYGFKDKKEGQQLLDSIVEQTVNNAIFNVGFAGVQTALDTKTLAPIIKRSAGEALATYKALPAGVRQAGFAKIPGQVGEAKMPEDVERKLLAEFEDLMQGATRDKYGDYAGDVNRLVKTVRIAGEKTSKKTGELFREHVPSPDKTRMASDEIADALGMTENELMSEVTEMAGIVGGGTKARQILKTPKTKIGKQLKSWWEKLSPEHKVSLDWRNKPLAVSAEATPKTLERIEKAEAKAFLKTEKQTYAKWSKAARTDQLTLPQAVNKAAKEVGKATDASIKNRLEEETAKVYFPRWRTPEYVLDKMGLKDKVYTPLKQGQGEVSKELKGHTKQVNAWWKRVKGINGSSENIFNYLDGEDVTLSEPELGVAKEIRTYLLDWADRLELSPEKRITNYITHIFEPDFVGGKRIFPAELARILDFVTPNKEFNPFLEERLGAKGYKRDVFEALDAYAYRGARKLYLDKPLAGAAATIKDMPAQAAIYVDRLLKNFKGRPSEFEKSIEQDVLRALPPEVRQTLGARPVNRLVRGVTGAGYRGMLGFNLVSPIRNLTQVVNTISELGVEKTAKGYMQLLSKGTEELVENGVLDDMIIADYKSQNFRGALQKADKALFFLFDLSEKINRGSTYYAAKSGFLEQGLSEGAAVEAAKEAVRKTQFAYGKLDLPLALQTPLGKMGFQFGTFKFKQAELVGGWLKQKEGKKLARYVLSSLATYWALGDLLGVDWHDAFTRNIFPSLGPIPEALLGAKEVLEAPEGEKKWKAKKLGRQLTSMVIPGGVQARRTLEGAKALMAGGSYTPTGKLRFPIEPKDAPRVLTAGQWSLPQAKTYVESGFRTGDEDVAKMYEVSGELQGTRKEILDLIINGKEDKARKLAKKSGVGPTKREVESAVKRKMIVLIRTGKEKEAKKLYNKFGVTPSVKEVEQGRGAQLERMYEALPKSTRPAFIEQYKSLFP